MIYYRILTIGGSDTGKTNSLSNQQLDIDEIYFYTEDSYESKYQFLINKIECTGLKDFNDSKACIEYLDNMVDIYEKDYNWR